MTQKVDFIEDKKQGQKTMVIISLATVFLLALTAVIIYFFLKV